MKPFKVGDPVWSFQHGKTSVQVVLADSEDEYPILVNLEGYRKDGKYFKKDHYATLYHLDDARRLFPHFFEDTPEPEPQKKKKLLAPAIVLNDIDPHLTWGLYESKEQAQLEYRFQVIWPAIPNKDGYYEVEE